MKIKSEKIFVEESLDKGRGIFSSYDFSPGDIIELCPVLTIRGNHQNLINMTPLKNYVFQWGQLENEMAIVLGFGSLYNHSYKPNAIYIQDYVNNIMKFKAIENIKPGQEITVNYNGDPKSNLHVGFQEK